MLFRSSCHQRFALQDRLVVLSGHEQDPAKVSIRVAGKGIQLQGLFALRNGLVVPCGCRQKPTVDGMGIGVARVQLNGTLQFPFSRRGIPIEIDADKA